MDSYSLEKDLCTFCNVNKIASKEMSNSICSQCLDTIEFGYPSFAAYKLEDIKLLS